ncbi:MAG: Na/Pi cotransporter family protein [Syntrophales bacterium]|nr:Na/Pi cotransporter family protein [Syntrophales bacterium]
MGYIKIIVGVIGGLGLFIYGMYLLSDSLKKLSLNYLKTLLEKMTSNRIKAMLAGLFVTSVIQSSSATSVIIIGFLNAGIISLAAAIAVMIGANVGTTVTAQLIAFKLTTVAPLFVFVGAITFFFAKKNKNKNKGLALLGFGLLFLGLTMMSSAVKPLADNEATRNVFISFGRQPLLGILIGLTATAILQSSSTTIGMIIAFASGGLLDLPSSIYLIFGTNVGTCITAIIASIGGNLSSKRLALGNTLFNLLGTMIAVACVPFYMTYIPMVSSDIARQVATTHTIFNVINTIVFLPIVSLFIKLLYGIIPGKDYEKKEVWYLDKNLLTAPNLAIDAVIKELGVMISTTIEMLDKAKQCVISYNHKLKNEISIDEGSVDDTQKSITEYLVEITKRELTEKQARLIPALLHSVNDVERAADYCENIANSAQRFYENDLTFSEDAQDELNKLFEKTLALMRHAKKAVENNDNKSANITLNINSEIRSLIKDFRLNHIKRLEKSTCISDSGLVFSDILSYIERLNAHLCNITKGILHIGKR